MPLEQEILRLAAAVSNPWGEPCLEKVGMETASLVAAALQRNKVSFLSLADRYGEDAVRGLFGDRLSHEAELFEKLRREFERVKRAFAAEGIETILIKSTGLYPSFPHLSSNLDVLVERERGDDARKLLHENGYVELINTEEPGKFLFRRFAGDETSYTLHLHEEIGWGVPFVAGEKVWASKQKAPDDEGVSIPGPRESLLITLAHWFYEDKELNLSNLYLTAKALSDSGGTFLDAAVDARAMGWEQGFHAALLVFDDAWSNLFGSGFIEGDGRERLEKALEGKRFFNSAILERVTYMEGIPARIPFLADKAAYYHKISIDPSRRFSTRAADWIKTFLWAVRWKMRIKSQKPWLVSLSGCDGSGKTVQAELLLRAVKKCDLRVTTIWYRGGSSRLMSFLTSAAKKLTRRAAAGEAGDDTEAGKVRYRRRMLANPLMRFLYAAILTLDVAWVYAVKTRMHLLLGRVVICDRYVEDAIVDFAVASGRPIEKVPAVPGILLRLAPRADSAFLLDVEEDVALARKPEEGDISHLVSAREAFKTLAGRRGHQVIPPGETIENTHEIMTRDTLQAYYARYGTLINAVLLSNPGQVNPGRWRPAKDPTP